MYRFHREHWDEFTNFLNRDVHCANTNSLVVIVNFREENMLDDFFVILKNCYKLRGKPKIIFTDCAYHKYVFYLDS